MLGLEHPNRKMLQLAFPGQYGQHWSLVRNDPDLLHVLTGINVRTEYVPIMIMEICPYFMLIWFKKGM